MESNYNEIEADSQEWDWELLLSEDSHPQFQNPSSQIRPLDVDSRGDNNGSSFSDGDVIRCDYFSLEFGGHGGVDERGCDVETDRSGSETGSWLDPDLVRFGGDDVIRGRTGRAHLYSDSDSATPPLSDNDLGLLHHEGERGDGQNTLRREIDEGDDDGKLDLQNYRSALEEVTHGGVGNDQNALGGKIDRGNENGGLVESRADNSGGWWKVPLELLRYCVLRVRPVWSLSVAAAAIMGFVLLRRTWLVKTKRKSYNKSLSLNVTVDDKKVSQFMSRVARLNEAFSVVKRVPVIRPSLPPPPGLAPWPVISMW